MTMAISLISGLVFSSAAVGGMNAARFDNFLAQVRRNLDLEEGVIFVFLRSAGPPKPGHCRPKHRA